MPRLIAMLYLIHVTAVTLSGLLFLARGVAIYTGMAWVEARWVRIAPHVVDTVLLVSALALAWQTSQYPFVQAWLTAKVIGLIGYIGLGVMAFRVLRGRPAGLAAFVAALLLFAWLVGVAHTRQVVPI